MSDSDTEKKIEYLNEKGFDSAGQGDVLVADDYGADSELQRRLSTRHITMIALGSSIGMGLWLGSGTSLTSGGPASIFIGMYHLGCNSNLRSVLIITNSFRLPFVWHYDLERQS